MQAKLGAEPAAPYKVPLSERIFGIGKLPPPNTEGVSNVDLLSSAGEAPLRLGDYALSMDERGRWAMEAKLESLYRQQILTLEAKINELESERLNKNVYELEQKCLTIEREKLQLLDENNQLKFKNKVLMAMCTISEGDYKALCKEAGIEPRAQKKPAPSPVAAPNVAVAAAPATVSNAQLAPPAQAAVR